MSGNPLRRALRPLSFAQIRWVTPVRRGAADRRISAIYREMERILGVISPPVALHSPAPDALAACWVMLYETLFAPGRMDRAAKEAVATAVSVGNSCPYCVTIHSTMLRTLDHVQGADAIEEDHTESIADPAVRAISEWARASVRADSAAGYEPPFPATHAPEAVGVAVVFHYFNRMVNVFVRDAPLPPLVPNAALPVVLPGLSLLMSWAYRHEAPPGASLDLLPAGPLPPALSWSAGNTHIAQAFARASSAVEAAGRRSVPAAVRDLVLAQLAGWDGGPKGLSRAWADEAVEALPADQRPAGRLALLVAFASYQVDDAVVAAVQATGVTDAALVELVSWASLAAAGRASGWMWITGREPGWPRTSSQASSAQNPGSQDTSSEDTSSQGSSTPVS
ncbi:MAG TPA: carboxymuconolactone decarboxylase family protein [Actinocrinis sp.]|uniref:carboxymuconolactone decarboxylase family protein n=1 Tax=Actinocrinis sp. TaxID=1920516 RepID=UPI002DDCFE8F|nr:carboxymuconolactone decarboxylase family protein [Actinocrinis sp.]HEV2347656.1 carboxymuconolactone decarboxylase family protein [Actinocrinis sp.]